MVNKKITRFVDNKFYKCYYCEKDDVDLIEYIVPINEHDYYGEKGILICEECGTKISDLLSGFKVSKIVTK